MEEKTVTIGRVFKVAFKRWKLFVPIAVGVTVLGTLAIQFGLNTFRGSYSSTFSYSSADLSNEKYADGSVFFYKNLLSLKNLTSVKESNEKYVGINVEKLLDANAINITKDDKDVNEYTITLGYKYMKDESLARNFIKDIAETALAKDKEIVDNGAYDTSLKSFDKAETFEEQVSYLYNQKNALYSSYETMVKASEDKSNLPSSVLETIYSNEGKLESLIPANFVKNMNYRISSNGYVKDYNVQAAKNYEYNKQMLNEEKSLNEAKINDLNVEIAYLASQSAPISTLSEKVVDLSLRNSEIDYEITALDNKIANKGVDPKTIPGYEDFVNDLTYYCNKLSDYVDEYKAVLTDAYIVDSAVAFESSSITKLNGTINIFVGAALSLVIGVVVGAIVNLIVDHKELYE